VFLMFCCSRYGWGWNKFIAETDQGQGLRFPHWIKPYLQYVLPLLLLFVLLNGYIDKFTQ
ncbi:MAG: sodium-dependent transporter, partial [Bilophila sp.]